MYYPQPFLKLYMQPYPHKIPLSAKFSTQKKIIRKLFQNKKKKMLSKTFPILKYIIHKALSAIFSTHNALSITFPDRFFGQQCFIRCIFTLIRNILKIENFLSVIFFLRKNFIRLIFLLKITYPCFFPKY